MSHPFVVSRSNKDSVQSQFHVSIYRTLGSPSREHLIGSFTPRAYNPSPNDISTNFTYVHNNTSSTALYHFDY